MDSKDASAELKRIMQEYEKKDYIFWKSLIEKNDQITFDFTNDNDNWYQVEIHALYEDSRGTIRVFFAIDDGKGWRSQIPLASDFLVDFPKDSVGSVPSRHFPYTLEQQKKPLPTVVVVILPIIVALLSLLILSLIIK